MEVKNTQFLTSRIIVIVEIHKLSTSYIQYEPLSHKVTFTSCDLIKNGCGLPYVFQLHTLRNISLTALTRFLYSALRRPGRALNSEEGRGLFVFHSDDEGKGEEGDEGALVVRYCLLYMAVARLIVTSHSSQVLALAFWVAYLE